MNVPDITGGLNCEELVVISTHKPDHKSVYYQTNGNYVTSQNCIVLGYGVKTLVITCMYDLRHIVPHVAEFDAEKANLIGEYFLSNKEKLQFISVFIDPNLQGFFQDVFPRNDSIKCRVQSYNADSNQLAAFGVFECNKKFQAMQISQLAKNAPDINIGDDLTLLSNAFSLSFKELFGKATHKCICSSISEKGIFILDFRGYPDIECSMIFKKISQTKANETPCGIVIPGVFHKNNYREYLTFGYSLKHLCDNLGMFLTTHYFKAMEHPRLSRLGMLAKHLTISNHPAQALNPKLMQFNDFWLSRLATLTISDDANNLISSFTCILLSSNKAMACLPLTLPPIDHTHTHIHYDDRVIRCLHVCVCATHTHMYVTLETPAVSVVMCADASDVLADGNVWHGGLEFEGESCYVARMPLLGDSGFEMIPLLFRAEISGGYENVGRRDLGKGQRLKVQGSSMTFKGSQSGILLDRRGRILGFIDTTMKYTKSNKILDGDVTQSDSVEVFDLSSEFDTIAKMIHKDHHTERNLLSITKKCKYIYVEDSSQDQTQEFNISRTILKNDKGFLNQANIPN